MSLNSRHDGVIGARTAYFLSASPPLSGAKQTSGERVATKGMAQIGAAIGREFSHTLLAAVVPKPEAQLGAWLDRLIRAGLLLRTGRPPLPRVSEAAIAHTEISANPDCAEGRRLLSIRIDDRGPLGRAATSEENASALPGRLSGEDWTLARAAPDRGL
jgi:hypothetical protein